MTKLILSLTTIPPRFPFVKKNLQRLLNQSADIAEINLYVAKKYRRFPYEESELPEVPEGINLRIVEEDLGPATKVLPAAREYAGQDVQILFCDDDKLYDNNWAQRYVDAAKEHPDCCIVEEGGHLDNPVYANDGWVGKCAPRAEFVVKDWRYRLRRAASLGMWKPSKALKPGYVDILEGWGGVLVRPEFFDALSYEIPEVLWTVDDVWLSGCLERQGIPIWLNTTGKIRSKEPKNEGGDAALRKFVYMGHDRIAANRACIEYFRETYGVWGGKEG